MKRLIRIIIILLILFIIACQNPLAIEGARSFTPNPKWGWRTLYDSAATCAGLTGDYDRIRWFEAEYLEANGEPLGGLWKSGHRIYLVRKSTFAGRGTHVEFKRGLVHHEMIHDLTNGAGHDHPAFRACDRV